MQGAGPPGRELERERDLSVQAPEVAAARVAATILVVEDDPGVLYVLGRWLRSFGYRVLEATSSDAALTSFAAAPFDLLIADFSLPGELTGLELWQRLRERKPVLPAIVVSGHSAEVLGRHVGRHGPLCLSKPFDPETLAATIKDCLAGQ